MRSAPQRPGRRCGPRGFGGNPGSPSEEGLARDADAAVAALRELGYPPERTVYFGESLGTGVVAALQERHPPAGVVLRSPFTELADVGAHHYWWLPVGPLLRDSFPWHSRWHAPATNPVSVMFGRPPARTNSSGRSGGNRWIALPRAGCRAT